MSFRISGRNLVFSSCYIGKISRFARNDMLSYFLRLYQSSLFTIHYLLFTAITPTRASETELMIPAIFAPE